jgi:uncharacterized membrane protein YphA (DoxX/SURF4 family)
MSTDPSQLPAFPSRSALDRAALERVLLRAAELQSNAPDPAEEMTEEQLLELGREVGLTPEYLRQALIEERTRVVPPVEHGVAARLVGPATAMASRTVRGRPDAVLAALDSWMQREECLQVKRRFADRMIWETRRDPVGNIKRFFNIGGRGYHLTRAHEVGGMVVPVDAEHVLVRLDANLANVRSARVTSGGLAVAGGALTSGVLVTLGFFVPVAAVPTLIGALAAYFVFRGQPEAVARAQLALEQVLDRLEHGESRPSLLGLLTQPRLR